MRQHFFDECAGVGTDRHLDMRLEFRQLRRVDVDDHLVRGSGQLFGRVSGDGKIQSRANCQQEIAVL